MIYLIVSIVGLIALLILLKTFGKLGFMALILGGLYIAANKK